MRRRRFLQISAAAVAVPGRALAETVWRGQALGANVSVALRGDPAEAQPAIAGTQSILRRMEAEFSLFDSNSAICRLNRTGRLVPSAEFRALCAESGVAHRLTGGLFDPTVQRLWHARAAGLDEAAVRRSIGWDRVTAGDEIRLAQGQAITFNGIAQGFATDRVRDFLAERGFGHALIDVGEFAAVGGPFNVGIADPEFGLLGRHRLENTAVATSSPFAMTLAGGSHILGPAGQEPLWSTVSVEADRAALADALSTALVFLDRPQIETLLRTVGAIRSVTLIFLDGDLTTLTA